VVLSAVLVESAAREGSLVKKRPRCG